MSNENLFDLEDLSSMMSVKKEKVSPLAPKSRPITRAAKGKKRKSSEMIDLESNGDSIARAQEDIQMWIEEKKVMHDELVEVKAMQKTAHHRCAILDKENSSLIKQIKDLVASSSRKVQETIDGAKRSVVMAILQAKIQMAVEAGDKGLELWKENLESWTAILDKMKGEKPAASVGVETLGHGDGDTGTSKNAGGGHEEEVVVAAVAGDEGCHA